jgi:hypothetical protein
MHKYTNGIMQENLQNTLNKIVALPINDSDLSNDVTQMRARNWSFNFYLAPQIVEYSRWLENSDESSNFTYGLKNIHHLQGWIATVAKCKLFDAERVVKEIFDDDWLINYLVKAERTTSFHKQASRTLGLRSMVFGRRIGWYAITRLRKPTLVVETGVAKGLGSVLLCRALMRNCEEGYNGSYLGTDIDPHAGVLFSDPLTSFGKIAYGDSIQTLRSIRERIGLFINDSDHSAEYEAAEYEAVANNLDSSSIVLGDNSHVTNKLFEFARNSGRNFLHFAEQPDAHWYPGAGIGAAFF